MPRTFSRLIAAFAAACALAAAAGAAAARDLAGLYELAEGPDAAGMLELRPDGRFVFALIVGALDEAAHGRWERRGEQACLTSQPTPRPPAFERRAPRRGQQATVLVEGPKGHGVAGIDVVVGFDQGEPVTGYTQYDGWSLPPDERRTPRWVQLTNPIHRFSSPRLPLAAKDRGRLRAKIVANDLPLVDFREVCLEESGGLFVLRRPDGILRFTPASD